MSNKALARDRYRCTITGAVDSVSCIKYPILQLEAAADLEGANILSVEMCHILNVATMRDIDPAGGGAVNKVWYYP